MSDRTEPRRLLLAGDVHGNTGHLLRLVGEAGRQGCDAIVQLGDIPECFPTRRRIREVMEATQPSHLFHGHLHVRYNAEVRLRGGKPVAVHGLAADIQGGPSSWLVIDLRSVLQESAA